MSYQDMIALARQCQRFLTGNNPATTNPQAVLMELAKMVSPETEADMYGEGDLIESFEAEVAELLDKEAAVFMPSGTMAQQIALRIWSERKQTRNVAFHPKCHLEIHEQKGYQMLHNLHGVLVGSPDRLMTLDDLKKVAEPLAALLIELPQREIGGQLPSWEDLQVMAGWARGRNIALHMDGARLWECKPFYQREYAEIASLFDTVYVSVYKGLGGITGCLLAGPADFIAEARIWQRRYGGNLIRMYPFVLSAKRGLATVLGQMDAYYQKARKIAGALSPLPGIEVVPNPPQTNMMHVYLKGDRERLENAAIEIAHECGVFMFYKLAPSPLLAYQKLELTVREGTLELGDQEIADLFQRVLEKART